MKTSFACCIFAVAGMIGASAFTTPSHRPYYLSTSTSEKQPKPAFTFGTVQAAQPPRKAAATPLFALLDVPDGFFTISFGIMGFMLSAMRNVNRHRMEELAWEQRLAESREKRLAEDPTLLESDLLKQEAENEWSAYGPEAMEERKRRRVKVAEQQDDDEEDGYYRREPTEFRMTDQEIEEFENEYGVEYDPYYDDPYTEDELPDDVKFILDRKYGDRIYEDGEVFYKDAESGMYYRQGSKPRIKSFW